MTKIMASWSTLMQLANAVGDAKKNGTKQEIKEAEDELEAYRQVCLKADGMHMDGMTYGDMS
jgi:hypothetical protein